MRSLFLSSLAVGAIACGTSTPTEAPAPATEAPAPAEAPAAEAAATAAPEEASFGEVTLEELKGLVDSKAVVLLDANGSALYKEGHLPGAIDVEAAGGTLATVLPADKNALVVAYCGGEHCSAWKGAAKAAADLGYTQIKHYKGGFSGWKTDGGPVEI